MITLGGCDQAVREAVELLADAGQKVDYMRIRAFPFGPEVEGFLANHDYCYVVEQNRDGQLASLLVLETAVPKEKLRSILYYAGFPLSAKHVLEAVLPKLEVANAVNR